MKIHEVRELRRLPGGQLDGSTWIVVCAGEDGKFVPLAGAQEYPSEIDAQAQADRLNDAQLRKSRP